MKNSKTNSYLVHFPGVSDSKESACSAGDPGSIPFPRKIPWRKWQPTPVFLPGEFHGQRSLVGYNPRSRKNQIRLSNRHIHTAIRNTGNKSMIFFFVKHLLRIKSFHLLLFSCNLQDRVIIFLCFVNCHTSKFGSASNILSFALSLWWYISKSSFESENFYQHHFF